jgi:polyisoprenoid-binding protein YceI
MATTEIRPVTTPAAGAYTVDPGHSAVTFSARHLMVTKVRGRFAVSGGTITIGENPEESVVEATIDVGSVESGDLKRDGHLRSDDFFAVDRYPTITFRSTSVRDLGEGTFELAGDLTVRDVTRPVVLRGEYLGQADSPFGDTRIGFTAETTVNRKDWGLEWNVALESGGFLVGEKVNLTIDVEAVRT